MIGFDYGKLSNEGFEISPDGKIVYCEDLAIPIEEFNQKNQFRIVYFEIVLFNYYISIYKNS